MKCRGYGLGKRTSFSIYSFDLSDVIFTMFLILCAVGIYVFRQSFSYAYYPEISFSDNYIGIMIYAAICFAPVVVYFAEVKRWSF